MFFLQSRHSLISVSSITFNMLNIVCSVQITFVDSRFITAGVCVMDHIQKDSSMKTRPLLI